MTDQSPSGTARLQPLSRALAFAAALWVMGPALVVAQEPQGAVSSENRVEPEPEEILLKADTLTYDQNTRVVTASGSVEVVYGERVLFADEIIYDQNTGTVMARGNVSLTDAEGNVAFAENAEITEDLREGVIRQIEIVLTDESRLTAERARREDGNVTTLRRATYTACRVCPENPTPLWEIRARKIVHDQVARTIRYEGLVFAVKDVPIMYVPFFSHPDPTVRRKSGFLSPLVGRSSDLGFTTEIPYYWAIKPWRDLTVAPLFTSDEGVVMQGQYRERMDSGGLQLDGSITHVDQQNQDKFRGHIFGEGRFAIDETWRWGFDVERATDDTYLKRYDFADTDTLTSRVFTEGFRSRNYAVVNFFAFQGLEEEDDPGETPLVMPYAHYDFMGDPTAGGGWWEGTANLAVLQRHDGPDTRRLSTSVGYRLPFVSGIGDRYTLFAQVRGDVYHLNEDDGLFDDPVRIGGDRDDGLEARVRPVLGVDWRYPLVRPSGSIQQYLEPIVQLIYTPYGGNPDSLPNEDSISFEFDETNLFSINRFPGRDRWEGGPRANVGVKWSAYWPEGGVLSVLVGEVFRLKTNRDFAAETGLANKFSDFVGRIVISPSRYLHLVHRFRVDRDELKFSRNEVMLSGGPDFLRVDLNYVRLQEDFTLEHLPEREEINATAQLKITDNWSLLGGMRRDLADDRMLSSEGAIFYSNECVLLGLGIDRRFTSDRDVRPSTSINVRVVLRNLS